MTISIGLILSGLLGFYSSNINAFLRKFPWPMRFLIGFGAAIATGLIVFLSIHLLPSKMTVGQNIWETKNVLLILAIALWTGFVSAIDVGIRKMHWSSVEKILKKGYVLTETNSNTETYTKGNEFLIIQYGPEGIAETVEMKIGATRYGNILKVVGYPGNLAKAND